MEEEKSHNVHTASMLQRPTRTNLSSCLGLIDNGQYKSTNRLLVLVPHERPHRIMRTVESLCMLLPKALKMRAINDTMALVADSIGGTKCAPAQMSWHLRHLSVDLFGYKQLSKSPANLCWISIKCCQQKTRCPFVDFAHRRHTYIKDCQLLVAPLQYCRAAPQAVIPLEARNM